MTLGGYVAFAVNVSAGMPLAVAILAALAAVAGLGLVLEFTVWAPMRRRGAGILQLLLLSIGLAFVIRNMILFEWGGDDRKLDVDQFQSWNLFGDVNITAIQVTVIAIAGVVLVGVATMLRTTLIGKTMRALSDSFDLAEVSGVNTRRVVIYTWLLAGSLAGLAGVLAAIYTTLTPNTGWFLLLSVFAAVVLGGIGNAYGALVGGLVLGLVQEWSTMLVRPTYKEAIGFLVLILVLLVRPQGIFGQARTV
jgi:neutral amino acid transport system permease protein